MSGKNIITSVILIGLLLIGNPVVAQQPEGFSFAWHNAGPSGTSILTLMTVEADAALYAGTDGQGVYRSTNFGDDWLDVTFGTDDPTDDLPQVGIVALDRTRRSDGTSQLWAISWQKGVYYSDADALTAGWHVCPKQPGVTGELTGPLASLQRAQFILDFYVHNETIPIALVANKGAFIGTPDCQTDWERLPESSQDAEWQVVSGIPGTDILLAGQWDGDIVRSEDGGVTWQLSETKLDGSVRAFAVSDEDLIFASMENHLFTSTDQGQTWHEVPANPLTSEIISIYWDDLTQQVWIGTSNAAYSYQPQANRWQRELYLPDSNAEAVVRDFARLGDFLFVATAGAGIWRYDPDQSRWIGGLDDGKTFNRYLPTDNLVVKDVAITADGGRAFVAVWGMGVWAKDIGTADWSPLNEGLPAPFYVETLAVVGTKDDYTLYAGTWGNGLLRRQHDEVKWTSVTPGSNYMISDISVSSQENTTHIYAAAWNNVGVLFGEQGDETWETLNDGLPDYNLNVLSVLSLSPAGRTFLGMQAGEEVSGLYYRYPNGVWTTDSTFPDSLSVRAFYLDPTHGQRLYAATGNGLYSTDLSSSTGGWQAEMSGNICCMVWVDDTPIVFSGDGIVVTYTDEAERWETIGYVGSSINTVELVNGVDGENELWVATEGQGLQGSQVLLAAAGDESPPPQRLPSDSAAVRWELVIAALVAVVLALVVTRTIIKRWIQNAYPWIDPEAASTLEDTPLANLPKTHKHLIFISYRRQDSEETARHIHDRLVIEFAQMRFDAGVFLDDEQIEAGYDWFRVIFTRLIQADVLLAITGRKWPRIRFKARNRLHLLLSRALRIKSRLNQRRLDDPNDYVRYEIRTALEHNTWVIPVWVDIDNLDTTLLPEDIKQLAEKERFQITTGSKQALNDRIHFLAEKIAGTLQEKERLESTRGENDVS